MIIIIWFKSSNYTWVGQSIKSDKEKNNKKTNIFIIQMDVERIHPANLVGALEMSFANHLGMFRFFPYKQPSIFT